MKTKNFPRFSRRLALILASLATIGLSQADTPEAWTSGTFSFPGEVEGVYRGDQRNVETIPFAGGFLMLWDDGFDGTFENIYGRLLSSEGEWITGRFLVSQAAGDEKRPAVGVLSDRALVVWEDPRDFGSIRDLYATFVETDGSVLNPRGFLLVDTISDKSDVEAAVAGDVLLVVWEDREVELTELGIEVTGASIVHALRFDRDGLPIDENPIEIGRGVEPAVTAGDGEFMIVYQGQSEQLLANKISADPAEEFPLAGTSVQLAGRVDEPTLIWDGTNFAAAWIVEQGGRFEQLVFSRITPDLALLDSSPINLGTIHEDGEFELFQADSSYKVVVDQVGGIRCGIIEIGFDPEGAAMVEELVVVSQPRNRVQDPSASLAPDGTILVAWEDQIWESSSPMSAENIFWVIHQPGEDWSEPALLGPGPIPHGVGRTSLLRDGDGIGVLWSGSPTLYYTRLDADGGWAGQTEIVATPDSTVSFAADLESGARFYWVNGPYLFSVRRSDFADPATVGYPAYLGVADLQNTTYFGHDGKSVLVVSLTRKLTGEITTRAIHLAEGTRNSPPVEMDLSSNVMIHSVLADNGNFLVLYSSNNFMKARRVRVLPDSTLEVDPETLHLTPFFRFSLHAYSPAVAWPGGVEIVGLGPSGPVQIWIPWEFGANGEATELTPIPPGAMSGPPLLYQEGNRTVAVFGGNAITWENQDPTVWTSCDPLLPADLQFYYPPITDATGRQLFLRPGSSNALLLSSVDEPKMTGVRRQDGGGGLEIHLAGPPFGIFGMETASDLELWTPTGVDVQLDGSGRGTFVAEDRVDPGRFWRGIYRPN